jgi:hypothetical protein
MSEANTIRNDEACSLREKLETVTYRRFGPWSGGSTEPQYLVSLPGDARQNVVIAGHGSPEEQRRKEIEPIFGDVQYTGDLLSEWSEPAIGLGLSYNRDFRWAYISDKSADEVSPDNIHVEQITGTNAVPELVCANPEAEIFDRKENCVVHD